MKREMSLLERLKEYSQTDAYPFHMPGHKRQWEFPNPFSVDITEIEGFDNLHHPQGILKESMEWAASVYGADRTYYLVNGSSCGILSAICGTTNNSGTILLSRNSHKSAYHGVFLNHLRAEYIYPQILDKYGVQGGLLSEDVEEMLKTRGNIQAVFVVSPTYDGIVSDIKTIANITHKYKIPLIVDEAHGAHFRYGTDFPVSALDLGADVVIQSLHKTLPAFTQTALLHVKKGYVDLERLERYLHIYQSSSPSYLFLAGIENCIDYMEGEGKKQMEVYTANLLAMRKRLSAMRQLQLLDKSVIGQKGIFDLDPSKILIFAKGGGVWLEEMLRRKYHLEMEMCTADTVTAITSVADTPEGLRRLEEALLEIDRELDEKGRPWQQPDSGELDYEVLPESQSACTIFEAMNASAKKMALEESQGQISAEYVYIYPPGIPMVAPGEIITGKVIKIIRDYQKAGLPVQGPADEKIKEIQVVKGEAGWAK